MGLVRDVSPFHLRDLIFWRWLWLVVLLFACLVCVCVCCLVAVFGLLPHV